MKMRDLIRRAAIFMLLLWPLAAQAEWREAETAHFRIYSNDSAEDITRFATRLEKIHALMRKATAAPDDLKIVKVRVYVVPTIHDVQRALGAVGSDVAGFYSTNGHGPYAVTPSRPPDHSGTFSPEMVLYHEYAHHFMLQYFPAAYPSWYIEGFAELVGATGFLPNGDLAYGNPAQHRRESLEASGWTPVRDLLLKRPGELHGIDFYGQSWLLTHYLTFSRERAPQLRRYLGNLIAGKPPEQAATAFGDLQVLNREAYRYLASGSLPYRPVPVEIAQPVVQRMRSLSAGEAALIAETIAFDDFDLSAIEKEGDRQKAGRARTELLGRIRQKAARFPGDAYALQLLADAEYVAGNYPASEAAADRLLSIDPAHVRGMVRKGLLLLQAAVKLEGAARTAKISAARGWIIRANRAAPDEPQPLIAYYDSFNLVGQPAPISAVAGLTQAVETSPQDAALRMRLVNQLARDKRYAEAIRYLGVIAYSPHPSAQRAAALKQMAELRAALAQQSGGQPSS